MREYKKYNIIARFLLLSLFFAVLFLFPRSSSALDSTKSFIISNFGFDENNQFVIELFNPNPLEIDLSDYSLTFYSDDEISPKQTISSSIIKPFSYSLIVSYNIGSKTDDIDNKKNILVAPPDFDFIELIAFKFSGPQKIGISWRSDFDWASDVRSINLSSQLETNKLYYVDNLFTHLDNNSYLTKTFNSSELHNASSDSTCPPYSFIDVGSELFSPSEGDNKTEFNFFFKYLSCKSPTSEQISSQLKIEFFDESSNKINSSCDISELDINDDNFLDGKYYKFTCRDLPPQKIEYTFVNSEGELHYNYDGLLLGPLVREKVSPKISLALLPNQSIAGFYNLDWQIEGESNKYKTQILISQNNVDWQKLFEGEEQTYIFDTFKIKNGQYILKFIINDLVNPELTSEYLYPINISNYNPLSGDLIITEIMSSPISGCPEWFEIYNTRDFPISGYFIIENKYTKEKSTKDELFFSTKANSYLVIAVDKLLFRKCYPSYSGDLAEISDHRIGRNLSNSGDSIFLSTLQGALINSADFGSSSGQIWALVDLADNKWLLTNAASPGAENKIPEDIPDELEEEHEKSDNYSIVADKNTYTYTDNITNVPDYSLIKISGYITALPNQLGAQYFYIENDNFAIQVYNYNKSFPALSIGQLVEVQGELNKTLNRIKTSNLEDIKVFDNKQNLIPRDVSISDLPNLLHYLVKTTSKVEKKSTKVLYLENGLIIYLKDNSGLASSRFSVGSTWEFVGVIEKYKDEFRINPRNESDIKLVENPENDILDVGIPKTSKKQSVGKVINIAKAEAKGISDEQSVISKAVNDQPFVKSSYNSEATTSNQLRNYILTTLVISLLISIYYIRLLFIAKS